MEINKAGNLPQSFTAQLRCSLVADRCGYAPRSRLGGRQNPGGILPPFFISAALSFSRAGKETAQADKSSENAADHQPKRLVS
jgi:hypothetical protein